MARRPPPPPPPGRLRWILSYAKLAAWLVMLAALGGFAYLLYDTYVEQRGNSLDAETPLLRANPAPFKVEPTERGGLQVPFQDTLVLRSADGPTEAGPDQIGPPPEQPLPRPQPADDAEPPLFLPDEGATEALIMRGGGGYERPDPSPDAPLAAPAGEVAALAEQGSESLAAVAGLAGMPISVLPTPKPPVPDASVPAPSGNATIQVAAVPTEADAAGEWARLRRRYPDQLGDLDYSVEKLTDGQLFRLLAGPLDQRTANDRCEAIKAQRGDCFVRP